RRQPGGRRNPETEPALPGIYAHGSHSLRKRIRNPLYPRSPFRLPEQLPQCPRQEDGPRHATRSAWGSPSRGGTSFLRWLEETEDGGALGGIRGAMCRMPPTARGGGAPDTERRSPPTPPEPRDEPTHLLRPWPSPEYSRITRPRLERIARRWTGWPRWPGRSA